MFRKRGSGNARGVNHPAYAQPPANHASQQKHQPPLQAHDVIPPSAPESLAPDSRNTDWIGVRVIGIQFFF
jgi:hypothetical protein